MKKRVTRSLDEKLVWFLRNKQASMMLELNQPVSISGVTSFLLYKVIKAEKVVDSKLELVFVHPNGTHFPIDKI